MNSLHILQITWHHYNSYIYSGYYKYIIVEIKTSIHNNTFEYKIKKNALNFIKLNKMVVMCIMNWIIMQKYHLPNEKSILSLQIQHMYASWHVFQLDAWKYKFCDFCYLNSVTNKSEMTFMRWSLAFSAEKKTWKF